MCAAAASAADLLGLRRPTSVLCVCAGPPPPPSPLISGGKLVPGSPRMVRALPGMVMGLVVMMKGGMGMMLGMAVI